MWGTFDDDAYAAFLALAEQKYVEKSDLECNKPHADSHNGKSHIVKACYPGAPEGGKIIRFGQVGANTAGKPKAGESQKMKDKRAAFKARHAKDIAKGPSSGGYWANKVKW